MDGLRVVAFGGGHGLAAALRALRDITPNLTAVVGVSDNGGSSGRLRRDFGLIPPGDLRMALTALCADSPWGQSWANVLQHRFAGEGELGGHALGNLLIAALWQQSDVVSGLDTVGQLLGCAGRVLPVTLQPLDIVADVELDGEVVSVRGQVQVATARGRTLSVALDPADASPTPEALAAISQADLLVFGPGSWFTSVLAHLALPQLRTAVAQSSARRILIANLCDQRGETEGFSPAEHLRVLNKFAPEVRFDACFVDRNLVDEDLEEAARALGAKTVEAELASPADPQKHDFSALATAIAGYLAAVSGGAA